MNLCTQDSSILSQLVYLFQEDTPSKTPTNIPLTSFLVYNLTHRPYHRLNTCHTPKAFWEILLQKDFDSWLLQIRQWYMLILKLSPARTITLAIDAYLTVRASKKAPSTKCYHYHAQRRNITKPPNAGYRSKTSQANPLTPFIKIPTKVLAMNFTAAITHAA